MIRQLIILLLALLPFTADAQKREFRGAWIQCVNGQWQGMSPEKMQQTLTYQLDELRRDGCNAIIFQVRAECDALYQSSLEPWSRFLTGTQGVAPSPAWDPLAWMVTECHRRGMELHAWINPYRAKTKVTTKLASTHIAVQHPERVFAYDGLYILNPALEENRNYICEVVRDIVSRYDVDGLHIDDYFYPYPAPGQQIPDDRDFQQHSNGITDKNDWRRYNVNLFIQQLSETIHATKPWVKFGVSPFGIYHNDRKQGSQNASVPGSATNGLQNYDDLYADVLLWVNNGWIDYCVPQLYWQIGHTAADYKTLLQWWDRYASSRPLFIGEDVERTAKYGDMAQKMQLHNQAHNVSGTVLWYAKAAVDNTGNYGTLLRNNYWNRLALQPEMPFLSKRAPGKVRKVKPVWTADGYILFWTEPKSKAWDDTATRYAVYAFAQGETVTTDDAHLVAITTSTYYKLPYNDGRQRYTYVVTALNRIDNEGKPVKKKVKL